MMESVPLRWTLILVLAGTGLWFLFRGVRPGAGDAAPGPTDRISHLAHAVMAAVMAAMIWPMG
jgi:hypothetical protein